MAIRAAAIVLFSLFGHLTTAHADEGRRVRVFAVTGSTIHTGDRVAASAAIEILFLDQACGMPIVGARFMHRAWQATAAYQLGCWEPTIDDRYIFVGQLPQLTRASQVYWECLPRALLMPDGSFVITEPGYNSDTFMSQVNDRKVLAAMNGHRDERP